MRMRTILVVLGVSRAGRRLRRGVAAPGSALPVVASTNVYGDIAAQIGGAHVDVTSILSDPNADPHLFEPGTRNGLAVSNARLLIENGVGYDDFMGRLARAAPSGDRIVVSIGDALGIARGTRIHTSGTTSRGSPRSLPRSPAGFAAPILPTPTATAPGLSASRGACARSRARRAVAAPSPGRPVAYTEPVPGYLLAAARLRNLAPDGFTRAIENGTEPSPQAVAAIDALVRAPSDRVLLYNSQAVSPITARVRERGGRGGHPGCRRHRDPARRPPLPAMAARQIRALERALAK